jgi:hypothetical protein
MSNSCRCPRKSSLLSSFGVLLSYSSDQALRKSRTIDGKPATSSTAESSLNAPSVLWMIVSVEWALSYSYLAERLTG